MNPNAAKISKNPRLFAADVRSKDIYLLFERRQSAVAGPRFPDKIGACGAHGKFGERSEEDTIRCIALLGLLRCVTRVCGQAKEVGAMRV